VNHLCKELFRAPPGIDVVMCPIAAAGACWNAARTQQAMFNAVLEALPAIEAGATRPLAVSSRNALGVAGPAAHRRGAARL